MGVRSDTRPSATEGRRRVGSLSATFLTQVLDVLSDRYGVVAPTRAPETSRVSLTSYYDALAEAKRRDAGPVGVVVARALRPNAFEELGYLVRSCRTMGDALDTAVRYRRTWSDEHFALTVLDGRASVAYEPMGPAHPGHLGAAELCLGDVLLGLTEIGGHRGASLQLRGAAPPDVSRYTEEVGIPVRFGATIDRIEFDASTLALPLQQPDPALADLMRRRVAAQLDELPPEDALVAEVETAVRALMSAGTMPTARAVARRMHTSERTLYRELSRRDHPLRSLVNALRRSRESELRAEARPADEIAHALGFSSAKAYYRARAAWTAD